MNQANTYNDLKYPFPEDIKNILLNNYKNGNLGLRFNKFIPWIEVKNDKFHVCNGKGEENGYVKYYYEEIYKNKSNDLIKKLLSNKHINQYNFYKSYEEKYEVIIVSARLISPLITGIGQTHPNEIGMTFDHTIGIPYIPASTIKGIVRFSHILELSQNIPNEIKIKKDNIGYYFDEEEKWTNVSEIFGSGGNKGKVGGVIFLDAYPETIPELSVDIMNPHYGKYYSSNEAPADYLELNPIKFLTVKKDTKFIFRILLNKKNKDIKEKVIKAIENSLTEEGIGAKTAIDYGLFKIERWDEPSSIKNLIEKWETDKIEKIRQLKEEKKLKELENMSEVDKICYKLENDYMEPYSMEIFNKIDTYEESDKFKIAQSLKKAWNNNKKWNEKESSSKQKEKIKKIKSILKE